MRLVRWQGLQRHGDGLPGQIAEMAAAGDQHQAAVTPGQQRRDLAAAGGVVQHEQGPLPGHSVPPQRGPALQILGEIAGIHPNSCQQPR